VGKGFRRGTHRTISPEETLERVRPFLAAMGITRISNVTGLDRIGIPVVMACRPNSRALAVSQGKGLDLAAAKASAVMESVESYHAERIDLPLKLASYADLRANHRVVDVRQLPRTTKCIFHPHQPLLWIEGYDLLQQERVWVPYELVHLNYTVALRSGRDCFLGSSNGLASGNHWLEAISHAICEVVERDADSLNGLLRLDAQLANRIDLTTVDDPGCQEVLAKFKHAGVAVAVSDITSDVGLPAFRCEIAEAEQDPLNSLPGALGMGCHPAREVALLRALTEAAQSRVTVIAGSRDDVFRAEYETTRNPDALQWMQWLVAAHGPGRDFHDVPTFDGDTFEADVDWELERLRAVGIERVVVVDLTRPEFDLSIVRVVIPGLEGPGSLKPDYVHGARAGALVLKQRGLLGV